MSKSDKLPENETSNVQDDSGYDADNDSQTDNELAKMLETKATINNLSLYRFADKQKSKEAESKFKDKVHLKFFRLNTLGQPLNPDKKSGQLYKRLNKIDKQVREKLNEKQIEAMNKTFNDKKGNKANFKAVATFYMTGCIDLTGYSSRSIIIALSRILNELKYIPTFACKLGETYILCISKPTNNQKGNVELQAITKDGDTLYIPTIYGSSDFTKKFKGLNTFHTNINYFEVMRNQSRELSSSSEHGIQKEHAPFIDVINFLRSVIEVARRTYQGTEVSENAQKLDKLPISIAQTRTSRLLTSNKITFDDAYGIDNNHKFYKKNKTIDTFNGLKQQYLVHRAPYGAVTGQEVVNNVSEVINKIKRIDTLYNEEYAPHKTDDKKFVIEGRNLMRQRLEEELGAGNESSGSDYSSSDIDAEKITYKP